MSEKTILSAAIESNASALVDCAFKVHSALGPGLLESVYEKCMVFELARSNIRFRNQISVPIIYDGTNVGEGFRIDLLVDDEIIVEMKAVEFILPVHEAQILTYLKLTNKHLGFLINFNVPLIKQGIKRFIR